MPKVKNPAFSLAASGTLGGVIVFRQTARGAQAQMSPTTTPPATEQQAANRADFLAGCNFWAAMAADQKSKWLAGAQIRHRAARQWFLSEWRIQRATAENPPLLPAINNPG